MEQGVSLSPPAGPWAHPPISPPDLTPSRPIYDGKLSEIYAIYLRHLVWMLITLGWSRFWGRTRVRRYLWSHVSIFGDRFEYRGRGIELLVGFVLVLLVLAAWGGAIWLTVKFGFDDEWPAHFDLLDMFYLSLALVGIPLSFVGQYAGLRYRLSRTRWRAIRWSLAGSAWRYGGLATLLTFANAVTGQLLTPVVSVNLARPRLANAGLGDERFEFAGRAGDIYGRYVGYYFLNLLAWIAALAISIAVAGHFISETVGSVDDLLKLFARPTLRVVVLAVAAAFALYLLFSLLILPLRCWWQAYLLRYLVSHTRYRQVLFATSISTRQMWGFLVLNYLIVLLSLGLGWPWVMHRTLRLIASELWIYGAPDGAHVRQSQARVPRFGEGLLDMFDVTGI
jgi:uncharacterized membrane protein YjgN (DUF898 family)